MFDLKKLFKKTSKEEEVTTDNIRIIIKRLMANKVPVVIAKFIAQQKKDDNFNVVIEGDDGHFKKEISIMREKIIDFLKYRLDLEGLTTERKLEIINKKIKEQEDRIRKIEKGEIVYKDIPKDELDKIKQEKPDAVKVNIINERNKLKHYKVLKYITENEGEGSYEEIDIDGMRCMTFLSKEGDLIPVFHNASKVSMHEDVASKNKYYKQEQLKIEEEFMRENKNMFGGMFDNFLKVAFIIIFIAGIIFASYNVKRSSELDKLYSQNTVMSLLETNNKINSQNSQILRQLIDPNSTVCKSTARPSGNFVKDTTAKILGK